MVKVTPRMMAFPLLCNFPRMTALPFASALIECSTISASGSGRLGGGIFCPVPEGADDPIFRLGLAGFCDCEDLSDPGEFSSDVEEVRGFGVLVP